MEEMDEALIRNWNSIVGPKDHTIFLGDLAINRSALNQIARCNGTKEIVMGNHDQFRPDEYLCNFKDMHGVLVKDDFVFTHVPIHPSAIERWAGNIHGHLHYLRVMRPVHNDGWVHEEIDPRYFCASMEQINYTPIPFDTIKEHFKGVSNGNAS